MNEDEKKERAVFTPRAFLFSGLSGYKFYCAFHSQADASFSVFKNLLRGLI